MAIKDEVLTPARLRRLYAELGKYAKEIRREQPLGAQVIEIIRDWIEDEDRFDYPQAPRPVGSDGSRENLEVTPS